MNIPTFLKKRIIPIILTSNYEVVKSLKFSDYRLFGNLEQTISLFNNRNVDEIIILDIDASKKKINLNTNILKILSRESIMPLTYGGGIQNLYDIENCLRHGCDKVSINSKFLTDKKFIKESVRVFGSQSIVASVDYKIVNNNFFIYSHATGKLMDMNIFDHIKILEDSGAGEILLTSCNNDGLMAGYETTLLNTLEDKIRIPIILNGGCGSLDHALVALKTKASAIGMSSIFYFTQYSYSDIKKFLKKKNCNVR